MISRCSWCGDDPLYVAYHDQEWGVPVTDDRKLFEFLCLESAQAGLSWITILRRREAYRKAFLGFDPERVVRMTEADVQRLMGDASIIRNQAKIRACINNARAFLKIQEDFGSFALFQWQFVNGEPLQGKRSAKNPIVATSEISDWFTHELKSSGFQFLGSTVIYAHMQACGMVNDHLNTCFRHSQVKTIQI